MAKHLHACRRKVIVDGCFTNIKYQVLCSDNRSLQRIYTNVESMKNAQRLTILRAHSVVMMTNTSQAISHYCSVCNWRLHLQSNASGRYLRTTVAYRQRNARTLPDLSPSNSHRDRWTYKLHRQTYTFNRTYRELYKSPVAWRASGFLWCDKPHSLVSLTFVNLTDQFLRRTK